jgi:hypothetical protein
MKSRHSPRGGLNATWRPWRARCWRPMSTSFARGLVHKSFVPHLCATFENGITTSHVA